MTNDSLYPEIYKVAGPFDSCHFETCGRHSASTPIYFYPRNTKSLLMFSSVSTKSYLTSIGKDM